MKQLFWKEWMELRYVPLGCAAIAAICVIVDAIFVHGLHQKAPHMLMAAVLAYLLSPLVGLYVGAGLFGSEVGGGTLRFITLLPVSRGRIWFAKVLAGWLTITISVAAMSISGILLAALLGADTTLNFSPVTWPTLVHVVDSLTSLRDVITVTVLPALWGFAVALAVSPLTDNLASGLIISLVTAGALGTFDVITTMEGSAAIGGGWAHGFPMPLCVLSIPAFLIASYQTFTRGGSLRTPRRFYITGSILACFIAAFGVFVLIHG